MSALVHVASPQTKKAPVVVQPGNHPFSLPDGSKFTIVVAHEKAAVQTASQDTQSDSSDEQAQRVRHTIKLSTHRPHDWVDTNSTLAVISPCPSYPNPAAEPDTNSLAFRTKRFAECSLQSSTGDEQVSASRIWNWINVFFALWPQQEHLLLRTEGLDAQVVSFLTASKLAILDPSKLVTLSTPGVKTQVDTSRLLVSRAAFWQGFGSPTGQFVPWVLPLADAATRTALTSSNAETVASPLAPPFKPPPSAGPIYSRFIPGLDSHLTFRVASSSNAKDVDLITAWHATDRVNEGWRQRLSREEQLEGMQKGEQNAYTIGLIGEWDGEAWGYVEVYYSKHSNLVDFYTAGQYDRGFHALVGDERFRGPHRVRSWMGSVVHLMFLLDPSTTQCVSEPRLTNTKMVQYEMMVGGNVEKWIDFPHKRAALVQFGKERFFQLCPMGPLPEHLA
ncbi:aerobactin siderophore biosynthesis protein iucB [Pseudozyma hubeiensis SY62]|uniref:Aerobactin siderophore biosynthesis protein iucB n=1 Tax=Pseudozyma hubeiensis (strain SY62) TaxID=1305764 RepID=R9PER2_PSEHS|nr:aerobactin siderophore biosynthesis protein iucB [Pseudozyma hubeiensis SY62]GAC96600.1 aerobactin siderophore biosynthesis protein iucB [Pseudozyma hubeiensis SY62]